MKLEKNWRKQNKKKGNEEVMKEEGIEETRQKNSVR